MSWEGYWLPHLVDWTLGAAGSAVVAFLVRRWLRTLSAANADDIADLRRRLGWLEGRFGDGISASLGHRARAELRFRAIEQRLELLGRPMRGTMTNTRKRSTIAATVGVLLIAAVQWAATTPELGPLLGEVLPAPWGRLVLVLLGGLATVLAVARASKHPAPSAPAPTLEPPAAVSELLPAPAPAAATPPGDPMPSTAGAGTPRMLPYAELGSRRAEVLAAYAETLEPDPAPPATSIVQLLPLPGRAFL